MMRRNTSKSPMRATTPTKSPIRSQTALRQTTPVRTPQVATPVRTPVRMGTTTGAGGATTPTKFGFGALGPSEDTTTQRLATSPGGGEADGQSV